MRLKRHAINLMFNNTRSAHIFYSVHCEYIRTPTHTSHTPHILQRTRSSIARQLVSSSLRRSLLRKTSCAHAFVFVETILGVLLLHVSVYSAKQLRRRGFRLTRMCCSAHISYNHLAFALQRISPEFGICYGARRIYLAARCRHPRHGCW